MKRIVAGILSLFLVCSAYADNLRGLHTVVIDAGHGGHDSGAVSRDNKTLEKDLTLDIARKLAARIDAVYPDVKVILTRDSDTFVSLSDRAEIANKNGANLFISIHINASPKSTPCGYSVHVLGQSHDKDRDLFANNMDVVQRENAVMMLEDDYTTKYADFNPDDARSFIFLALMQNANLEASLDFANTIVTKMKKGPVSVNRGISQDPFYVLWKTSMPAVLCELGFISNYEEVCKLRDENNRNELAEILFESFREYKAKYDGSVSYEQPAQQVDSTLQK